MITDEEIMRIAAGLLTPGTTSKADLEKLAQDERGLTVILALEELCDHAELVLNRNRFNLEEIESLQSLVVGQYYSHKYDPRREEILQRGTPQRRADLIQEEARMDEKINALKEAYEKRLKKEEVEAKADPAKLIELENRRRANEAKERKLAEPDRILQKISSTSEVA